MRMRQLALLLIGVVALSACSGGALRDLGNPGEGPDEFRIVPAKPLETPESLGALPPPTPGGANRTDLTPLQDSVAVLGGRRPSATASVPGTDGGVVNYASRFGRDPGIRSTLASEDEAFRQRRARFTGIRIVREDRYARVYQREALNPQRALEVWRRAGARTPSAPPGP